MKKVKTLYVIPIVLFVLLGSMALAQTVTVDASDGSPNNTTTFSSLQLAITSFQASGDVTAGTNGSGVGNNNGNGAADVINITTTTVIDEGIFIDAAGGSGAGLHVLNEALTIQGSGVFGTVALKETGNGTLGNDCGLFWRQDVALTLKDIYFIPSLTNTPADDGMYFRATANAATMVVTVDNIVVTANDGANAPLTTTGLETEADAFALLQGANVVGFGDDGVYVVSRTEGGSITFNATNMVISCYNTSFAIDVDRTDELANDGIMVFMSGATSDMVNGFLNLGEGCVISTTPRFGIQNPYGGKVTINGSDTKPVILNNIHSDGIWNYSDPAGSTQPTICLVNNAIINNCDNSGIKEDEGETSRRGFIESVTNTIIANCKAPGIEFYASGARPAGVSENVTISNVTVHNCGYDMADPGSSYDFRAAGIASPTYAGTNKSNRNVNISKTIISGLDLTGLYNSSDGTYDIDCSSLVTQNLSGYNYALGTTTSGPSTITVGADVINLNPMYVTYGVNDYASADFMDVDNPAFAGKGCSGIDLAGGADYIGSWTPPLAAHNTWMLYQ